MNVDDKLERVPSQRIDNEVLERDLEAEAFLEKLKKKKPVERVEMFPEETKETERYGTVDRSLTKSTRTSSSSTSSSSQSSSRSSSPSQAHPFEQEEQPAEKATTLNASILSNNSRNRPTSQLLMETQSELQRLLEEEAAEEERKARLRVANLD